MAWFSRQREFQNNTETARLLSNRTPMIHALQRLGGMQPGELPKGMQAFGIAGGLGELFASHPPLEVRIAALQKLQG